LREKEIVDRGCIDMGDAPAVAYHLDRRRESRYLQVTVQLRERLLRQALESRCLAGARVGHGQPHGGRSRGKNEAEDEPSTVHAAYLSRESRQTR
jgi:hypothetical protein